MDDTRTDRGSRLLRPLSSTVQPGADLLTSMLSRRLRAGEVTKHSVAVTDSSCVRERENIDHSDDDGGGRRAHLLGVVFGEDSVAVELLQHILQLLRGVCEAKGGKQLLCSSVCSGTFALTEPTRCAAAHHARFLQLIFQSHPSQNEINMLRH